MKNLRITERPIYVDSYNTGDSQKIIKYEVRRDWEDGVDGFKCIPIADSVKNAGVVVEVFNSENNAKTFIASKELLEALNNLINKFGSVKQVKELGIEKELNQAINAINNATK